MPKPENLGAPATPAGEAVLVTAEEAGAACEFFSYGATRGNHADSDGSLPGPLTGHVAHMGSLVVKLRPIAYPPAVTSPAAPVESARHPSAAPLRLRYVDADTLDEIAGHWKSSLSDLHVARLRQIAASIRAALAASPPALRATASPVESARHPSVAGEDELVAAARAIVDAVPVSQKDGRADYAASVRLDLIANLRAALAAHTQDADA